MIDRNIERFQEKIGVKFQNPDTLILALTHSSYANETGSNQYNERLEFLGDSVLQLCITRYLYDNCKDNNEGYLTRRRASIVCEASLYKIGQEWELGEFLRLSKGEILSGGRSRISTIADTVEAIIAAIYLDKGYDFTCEFILSYFKEIIKTNEIVNYLDHKTRLQEYIQSKTTDKIKYELVREEGPSHMKTFYVKVIIGNKEYAGGVGKSKKEAEQNAAKKTLDMLNP